MAAYTATVGRGKVVAMPQIGNCQTALLLLNGAPMARMMTKTMTTKTTAPAGGLFGMAGFIPTA